MQAVRKGAISGHSPPHLLQMVPRSVHIVAPVKGLERSKAHPAKLALPQPAEPADEPCRAAAERRRSKPRARLPRCPATPRLRLQDQALRLELGDERQQLLQKVIRQLFDCGKGLFRAAAAGQNSCESMR